MLCCAVMWMCVCAILRFKKPHTFDWNRKYAFECSVCYTCIRTYVCIWKTALTIPYPKRMDRDYCRVCLPIFVFVFDFLNAHSFFAFIKSFYISYVDLFYVIRFNICSTRQAVKCKIKLNTWPVCIVYVLHISNTAFTSTIKLKALCTFS